MSEPVSDVWPRYLIQQTEEHDGEGCQADIILSGVLTLVFASLKTTADNEAFLALRLDSEP